MMHSKSLTTWNKRWKLIELWTSEGATESPAGADLSLAMVRGLTHPSQPEDVFADLLVRGFFAAAREWLTDSVVTRLLTVNKREHLFDQLRQAQKVEQAELQAKCGALEVRANRLMVGNDTLTRRLARCVELVAVSRDAAERALTDIAVEVDANGHDHVEGLRAQLAASRDTGELSDSLRRRVERYLDIGELDLAHWSLHGRGQSSDDVREIPQARPLWPFSEPPEIVCEWFLGLRGAPIGFARRWGLSPEDPTARQMIEMVAAIVSTEAPTAALVADFAAAVERFLGCQSESSLPSVQQRGSFVFATELRGLDASELPALSRVLELLPLPITVALTDVPPDGFEPPEPPGVLFSILRSPRWRADISIDATLLFRLVGSANRRVDFLREIGAQIPLGLALPENVPLASEERLLTRGRHLSAITHGARLAFVSGPPGMGKTAFLRAVADAFRRGQRAVDHLELTAVDVGLRADEASRFIEARILAHAGAAVVVVVDLASKLSSSETPEDVRQMSRDLRLLLDRAPGAHLVVTVPTTWPRIIEGDASDTTVIRLAPLASAETRSIVSQLLDILALPPSRPELVDRLVFYSAGWPRLLFSLLRSVLSAHALRTGTRRTGLTEEAAEAGWQSQMVTEAARELFLRDLNEAPAARLALGVLLQVFDGRQFNAVSVNELNEWWGMYAPSVGTESELIPALRRLADEGLLEYDDLHGTVRFHRSSVHQLLMRVVVDADAFAAAAGHALVKRTE